MIYALIRWRPAYEERFLPAEALGPAIWAGLRYVTLSPNLVRVMARALLFGFSAVAVMALLPVIARDRLGGDATTFGLMLGVFGLGAISGALASPTVRRVLTIERIVAGGALLFAAGLVLLGLATSLVAAVPGLVLAGAAWVGRWRSIRPWSSAAWRWGPGSGVLCRNTPRSQRRCSARRRCLA
jgi:predicted MFS family arabinose efflux permease